MIENIIAKLLGDFERGFMDRRQLVQSLALAAVAAVPGAAQDAVLPYKGKTPAFKTAELDHISFQVKDYRVTRDFYADLMGMEVKNDDGQRQCELYFGNSILLARNHFHPRGAQGEQAAAAAAQAAPAAAQSGAPEGRRGRGNRPPSTATVDHISYRIYDWDTDQVRDELVRRGLAKPDSKPDVGQPQIPGYSSFHVFDPDGFNLQISGVAGPRDSVTKK
ncbi:MAG TPA: VOC family protein [Bryobacteraceae bacterium]|jgi:catechol 2,3-dioxygenase-like lactoylglutathione lyase family enzyme|nr:VOC family protein [Bryobacteraceae bacterium]